VRVFLSTKRKANKAIRQTIKENPSNFFSFNNGISATAESVKIDNGRIVQINDFQIVNGGQTTATIHYTNKIDKISLEEVFVPVKITALKKDDDYARMVTNISLAANTQTTIKGSDFYANDSYLINIERISLKNPVVNDLDKNIYYFFERMNGQYSVTMASKGPKRQQSIWQQSHPKVFMFNKIDVARWNNMMYGLPFIAATGAENQFEDFMRDKHFEKGEITMNTYKTLVGFGLLFQRVYKLCGKANGKSYPSLTIDPVSGTHSPVALSTAMYTMSLLHILTEQRLDYWSIYNYQHGVCSSLVSKERIDSKFDKTLEDLIKLCWNQIAKFGGAAAQEMTKKKECWDFVKNNIRVSSVILDELDLFRITEIERQKRNSTDMVDEDKAYFEGLEILLSNNASVIQLMAEIANNQSIYIKERVILNNQIKKIKAQDQIFTKKKVDECIKFYNILVSSGFSFNEQLQDNNINIGFSSSDIFSTVFKNINDFIDNCENYVLQNEILFDQNEVLLNEVKEIIEKFEREYGLSIADFKKLELACDSFIRKA
jgi:hypothetical protein